MQTGGLGDVIEHGRVTAEVLGLYISQTFVAGLSEGGELLNGQLGIIEQVIYISGIQVKLAGNVLMGQSHCEIVGRCVFKDRHNVFHF